MQTIPQRSADAERTKPSIGDIEFFGPEDSVCGSFVTGDGRRDPIPTEGAHALTQSAPANQIPVRPFPI